jgi:TonB family protein
VQQVKLAAPVQHFTFADVVLYLYVAGAIIALFVLLFRLRKLYILTRNNHSMYKDQYKLINLNDENTAFSFFNYLFIGSNVPQAETIIAHEMVHIRQKHSIDIIFLEMLKMINWFNPFIYLIQRSLKTIHEYIADEQTAAHGQDALAYSSFLLNNAYGIQGASIAHSFFNYNLLKKRIIMLNKNRSGKLARLKYLAALPLCAGMLCTSTLVFSKDYGLIDLAPRQFQTVVKPATDSVTHTLQLTAPDGTKGTSDMIMVDDKKTGFKHTYTVNSLTEKDKAELKSKGFNLAIIAREEAQADTGKKKNFPQPPPPPPAPRVKTPKIGKVPSPPTPVIALDKPADAPKVDQIKFPPPVVKPDKPAKAPKIGKIKFPPPAGKPTSNIGTPPAVAQIDMLPPPPPPNDPAYTNLLKYIAIHTRYPTAARDNKINGHVILSVTINNEHKIASAKVEKGIGYGCDEEAARAIRTYASTINKAPGTYKLVSTFMLSADNDTKFYAPKPIDNNTCKHEKFNWRSCNYRLFIVLPLYVDHLFGLKKLLLKVIFEMILLNG